jgi:dihydrodipicolinate synthase/N-acetylneuraminate lyase
MITSNKAIHQGHLTGAIGALQAITVRNMRVMWELYMDGNIAEAMKLQVRANDIYQAIDDAKIQMIPAIKAVIDHRYSIPVGHPCANSPFKKLSEGMAMEELLARYDESISSKKVLVKPISPWLINPNNWQTFGSQAGEG